MPENVARTSESTSSPIVSILCVLRTAGNSNSRASGDRYPLRRHLVVHQRMACPYFGQRVRTATVDPIFTLGVTGPTSTRVHKDQ
jgi:hypothetical protein